MDSNTPPWERVWNRMREAVTTETPKPTETNQVQLKPWERIWNIKRENKPPVASPKLLPEHSIDTIFPNLLQAESNGVHMDAKGNLITSSAGAQGITQLMPKTAKRPGFGIEPVKDNSEKEYLRVGKEYLGKLYDKFGDWEKALAAYNAGVGSVMKAEGKAERFGGDWKEHLPKPKETLPYINKIMGKE